MTSGPVKPGMVAISRFIEDGERLEQMEICYKIANEIWIRIATLEKDSRKAASRRFGKREVERQQIEMRGLKIALRFALGVPYSHGEVLIDSFLNQFQQERLAAARINEEAQ